MDLHQRDMLRGRNLLKPADLTKGEFLCIVEAARQVRAEKRLGFAEGRLAGRNIALIFDKPSTCTRSAFEVAAHDEGASTTYIGPGDSHLGEKESVRDTARVLGRMFDAIEYRGSSHQTVEILGEYAGVPVWNGLTDVWHPTQMLADVLTMQDHRPSGPVSLCYLGDGRNNTANSLLATGAVLGLDIRICAPRELWPEPPVRETATTLAAISGARLMVSDELDAALPGADFVYTDVWLSMGEPSSQWDERIDLLLPYQVNKAALDMTGKPHVKFMHCLSALHNRAPRARLLHATTTRELRAISFRAGSMGPKVEAACRFAELTGGTAVIGRLDDAPLLLAGKAGTVIKACD